MAIPADFSSVRYLAAKKSVDDRALNPRVFAALAAALRERQAAGALTFLEVGCGLGSMVARLLDRDVLRQAHYTALDLDPEHIAAAARRVPAYARGLGWRADAPTEDEILLSRPPASVRLSLKADDLYDFASRERGRFVADVLLAHALLDLVDLDTALPALFALLKPGGLFYFSLNFDGVTVFLPPLEPGLDDLVAELYHSTMDERRVGGRPAGSSRTGRMLFTAIPRSGGRILEAGSSDWLVFPGPSGYREDEAYFLHHLVHTVHQALSAQPRLPDDILRHWTAWRHEQVERGELIYLAHQLDFFGLKEGKT